MVTRLDGRLSCAEHPESPMASPVESNPSKPAIEDVPRLVRELYRIVHELERRFPGRKFTLDGHLVGSIGEVVAARMYNLELLPASAPVHDATAKDGRPVQIKATQAKSVGLRDEPEHLLVLQLHPDGTASEAYNGPGELAWRHAGKMQRNGQRQVGVAKLACLMEEVPIGARLVTTR